MALIEVLQQKRFQCCEAGMALIRFDSLNVVLPHVQQINLCNIRSECFRTTVNSLFKCKLSKWSLATERGWAFAVNQQIKGCWGINLSSGIKLVSLLLGRFPVQPTAGYWSQDSSYRNCCFLLLTWQNKFESVMVSCCNSLQLRSSETRLCV